MSVVAAGRLSFILEQARRSHAEARKIELASDANKPKTFREVFAESLASASVAFNVAPSITQSANPTEQLGNSHTFLDAVLHNLITSVRGEKMNQASTIASLAEPPSQVESVLNLLKEMTTYTSAPDLASDL